MYSVYPLPQLRDTYKFSLLKYSQKGREVTDELLEWEHFESFMDQDISKSAYNMQQYRSLRTDPMSKNSYRLVTDRNVKKSMCIQE